MTDTRELSRNLLGPIFERFCYRLWLAEIFHAEKSSVMLFMSRGGLRIRWYYEMFLAENGRCVEVDRHDFYLSRISVFRALLIEKPAVALPRIAKEYGENSFLEGMSYFLPSNVFELWRSKLTREQLDRYHATAFSEQLLHSAVFDNNASNNVIVQHLHEQLNYIRRHFHQIAGDSKEVILIDTGWSGSIIQGLIALFPEVEFKALFIGRYNYGDPYPEWFDDIVGLEAEAPYYSRSDPITSLFHHRHIIEGVCEPEWPSVEYYVTENDLVMPAQGILPENRRKASGDELLATGIAEYIMRSDKQFSPARIHCAAEKAARALGKLICYPSAEDAKLFSVTSRSADFGKDLQIPMLIEDKQGSAKERIQQSLWLQGQAAIEFGAMRYLPQWLITHRYQLKLFKKKLKRIVFFQR